MSVVVTPGKTDVEAQVRASVLDTLTNHLAMDAAAVTGCLDGSSDDLPIASRVAIVVIARVQKVLGVSDLVDPKKLRPEQVTSVQSVTDLVLRTVRERLS